MGEVRTEARLRLADRHLARRKIPIEAELGVGRIDAPYGLNEERDADIAEPRAEMEAMREQVAGYRTPLPLTLRADRSVARDDARATGNRVG